MFTTHKLSHTAVPALFAAFVLASLGSIAGNVASASAVVAAPHWSVRTIALPSRFSPTDQSDQYLILVTNTGASATNAELPVLIKESLSSGVEVAGPVRGEDWASGEELECSQELLQCEDHASIPPDDTLAIIVENVRATTETGVAVNHVTIDGGGPEPVSDVTETPIGPEQAPFALQDFAFSASAIDGTASLQAGGHPYELTTSFDLLSNVNQPSQEDAFRPAQNLRDVSVTLPEGFVGNPMAAPRCPVHALEEASFNQRFETVAPCPNGSRVGLVTLINPHSTPAAGTLRRASLLSPLYNLTPEAGHAAEFGFSFLRQYAIVLYADLVHTSAGYRVRVSVPGIPVLDVTGAVVTVFGDPAARNEELATNSSFLTNPTRCSDEPAKAKVEADSWEEPGSWLTAESVSYPRIEGCDLLRFSPEVQVTPEPAPPADEPQTAQVDSPNGYTVDLKVPRAETQWSLLSSPELKGVTVTLPEGVSIAAGAADGLEGCEATGPQGIDMPHGTAHPDEAGEGEAIGPDGLSHLTAGHCPSRSQIGEVEISTPLLEHPLTGAVYIAQPKCGGAGQPACTEASATNGELYGLYLEAAGSGVVVKLKGNVSANPVTGQLTTTFQENPELPVSEVKVKLHGGPRAPLASPQTCGTATTSTVLEPWSAPITPDATPTSSFNVVGCGASMPFAPSFTAGTSNPISSAFSPFMLTFSRQDGEQDLSSLAVTTPPGLLGVLKSVVQCPEPQAQKGECGPQSEIGHTQVAAGAGSHPFWVGGRVYLTGPYKGAPFGLSVVVPAIAGPFNLGNVIVRAAIHIDPTTSALTVTSDPLPQIIDGVPLRVKTVSVTIDRPDFMFNPTNCTRQSIAATITAAQGASASVSSPFAVAGCKNLPFKPKFAVSTQGKASKANGASLHVRVTSGAGQANIAKVKVNLPLQLPSRLSTLQKACVDSVFKANPGSCPAASVVGQATAVTPLLAHPLTGPAYLVSHAGAAFPDLEIVLQGEGITLMLDGNTQIKKGITSSIFRAVPDAPISSFDLVLPEGPHSVLATNLPAKAKFNLCGRTLSMPTVITGQNGAVIHQNTKIAITGCPKHKTKGKSKKH